MHGPRKRYIMQQRLDLQPSSATWLASKVRERERERERERRYGSKIQKKGGKIFLSPV